MKIPNQYKFRKLRKALKQKGIEWHQAKGKGSHGAFVGLVNGKSVVYTLPDSEQKEVKKIYLRDLIRRFEIKDKNLFT